MGRSASYNLGRPFPIAHYTAFLRMPRSERLSDLGSPMAAFEFAARAFFCSGRLLSFSRGLPMPDQPHNSAPNDTVRMALSLGPAVGGRGRGNYVLFAILAAAANRYRSRRPPTNSSGGNA